MGIPAILVMRPGLFEQTLSPHLIEAPYEIWLQSAKTKFINITKGINNV